MEKALALCAALAVLAFQPHQVHSLAEQQINVRAVPSGPAERFYLQTSGQSETLELRQRLLDAGAIRVNCFLPDIIVCDLPVSVSIADIDLGSASRMTAAQAATSSVEGSSMSWVSGAYAAAYETEPMRVSSDAREPLASLDNVCAVMSVPKAAIARTQAAAAGRANARNISQNSEILVGTILVHLIFPESDTGPSNSETWTDGALASAATDAAAALIYYQIQYNRVDINFVIRRVERAATALEPIQTQMEDERFWVSDVMNNLGYEDTPDRYLEQVHAFNEEKRVGFGADWAFSVFIVNSENDADHRFEGAPRNAWAYLGGPHFVLPHPVGLPREGVAPPNFEQNFMHQIGHMFWGLDEHHRVLSLNCSSRSGYLNYQNGNKGQNLVQACFGPRDPCIMNLDDAVIQFYQGESCRYTDGMFGLIDDNQNGVPDAIDEPPVLEFEGALVDTVTERTATLRFKAVSKGVVNRNSRQVAEERVNYVLPVLLVARSQNGVIAEHLTPLDGAYDEVEEEFEYEVTALQSGVNLLKFITRNSARSQSAELTKQVYFLGLTYVQFAFEVSSDGVWIRWNLLGSSFKANIELRRVDTVTGEEVVVASRLDPSGPVTPPFAPYEVFDDATLEPGRDYEYYISGSFEAMYHGSLQTIVSESDRHAVRAALPISRDKLLSSAAPNPFNSVVWTSIDVPDSYTNRNGATIPARTPVEVAVYDVAGRRVKTLLQDSVFSQILTVGWDGTNRNNEEMPSGVYFIKAETGGLTDTRKVVLVR